MTTTVACTLSIPRLAEAVSARGLRLVPLAEAGPGDAAALVIECRGDPVECVAPLRAHGWRGALMLVLEHANVARALDAGADDAVAQAAGAEEIAARLAARLRAREAGALRIGALRIDRLGRRVWRDGRAITLRPREYALLLHLARRPGVNVSRAELLAGVWGLGFDPGTNVVEVHVSRLRAKLDHGFPMPMVLTEKGFGYRLDLIGDQGSNVMSAT